MKNPEAKLRLVLTSNAIFSSLSGLALIIFSSSIAGIMNIANHYILLFIGVGLLFFAGSILAIVLKKEIKPKKVKMVILQDWAWVVGSTILLLFNPFNISLIGNIMIAVIALIIVILALLQVYTLNKNSI